MSEEQLRRNAEDYIDENTQGVVIDDNIRNFLIDTYVAGAHSIDDDIKELKRKNVEYFQSMEYWQKRARRLYIRRTKQGEQTKELRDELDKLRNPWVSVEKRVPEFVEENNCNKFSDTKFIRVRNNQTGETRIDTAEYCQCKETKRCGWSKHELWWDETVTDWMDAPK